MLESAEFWSLFLSVIAGFGLQIRYLISIREIVSNNSERITKLETETHLEFDKCRLHSCVGGGKE